MRKFTEGDLVFHPRHGAGTVVSSTQKFDLSGADGLYYVVELATGGRLMIPISQTEEVCLQPLVTPEAIRKVLSAVPEEMASDFRQRRGNIEEKVNSGDQLQSVEVLRDLAWREHTSHLSGGDRDLMSHTKKRLAQILAMQPGMDIQEASRLLETILEQITLM
jgi:RNA polymerase-interacting CarD/CdnL/TRCF family regulator